MLSEAVRFGQCGPPRIREGIGAKHPERVEANSAA